MPLLLPQRPELHHAVGPWLPVRLFAAAALTVVNFVTAQMGSSTETTTPFSVEEYGMVGATGFDNAYYQAYQYRGSRILEHGSVAYRSFRWTQSGDVSSDGFVYLVDNSYHVVLELAPNTTRAGTTYVSWPAQYRVLSGAYGRSGYFDGIYAKSLFNGPMGISIGKVGIYIADTRNHALRLLNFATNTVDRRVRTLAGHPSTPGEQDGPSMFAKLRYPSSLGHYEDTKIFILDNHSRVRLLFQDHIITLVDGACRALKKKVYPIRIIVREVGCHDVWNIHKSGSQETALFKPAVMCSGHAGTCAPRDHPGLSDAQAQNLLTIAASRPQITGRRALTRRELYMELKKERNVTELAAILGANDTSSIRRSLETMAANIVKGAAEEKGRRRARTPDAKMTTTPSSGNSQGTGTLADVSGHEEFLHDEKTRQLHAYDEDAAHSRGQHMIETPASHPAFKAGNTEDPYFVSSPLIDSAYFSYDGPSTVPNPGSNAPLGDRSTCGSRRALSFGSGDEDAQVGREKGAVDAQERRSLRVTAGGDLLAAESLEELAPWRFVSSYTQVEVPTTAHLERVRRRRRKKKRRLVDGSASQDGADAVAPAGELADSEEEDDFEREDDELDDDDEDSGTELGEQLHQRSRAPMRSMEAAPAGKPRGLFGDESDLIKSRERKRGYRPPGETAQVRNHKRPPHETGVLEQWKRVNQMFTWLFGPSKKSRTRNAR